MQEDEEEEEEEEEEEDEEDDSEIEEMGPAVSSEWLPSLKDATPKRNEERFVCH